MEALRLDGTANINATGSASSDELYGNSGNNKLDGKAGPDIMDGGGGSDTYYVDHVGDIISDSGTGDFDLVIASVDHSLGIGVEDLHLTGKAIFGAGNDIANVITGTAAGNVLSGNAGRDLLFGLAGNDTLNGGQDHDELEGGTGADSMDGGGGDDTYIVDNAGDLAQEADNTSTRDEVVSTVSYVLLPTIDNLVLRGKAANGTGNDDANIIFGNNAANKLFGMGGADNLSGREGNDTLDGGTADGWSDTLRGGAGNDQYYINFDLNTAGLDAAVEDIAGAAGGVDTLFVNAPYALEKNFENLVLIGSAIGGAGNELANILTGNDLGNLLDGRVGADTMIGGKGDDKYSVDNIGDVVKEVSGGGHDTVNSTISYTLGTELDDLSLALALGPGFKGTGNALANNITGSSGDDTLNGVGGADTMDGGDGSDTMIVDNVGDVTSDDDASFDRVLSSVSHTIGDGVDYLTLTGKANINGAGNALSNAIEGNSGANTLSGLGGFDDLSGGAGNDSLIGGDDGDNLHGGAGFDTLDGGLGSDTYRFDKSSSGKDTILNFELGPTGDVLNLSELLIGFAEGVSNPNDFVRIVFAGGNMVMQVDANGLAGGSKFTDLAVLASYPDATIDQLMAGGNLQLAQAI